MWQQNSRVAIDAINIGDNGFGLDLLKKSIQRAREEGAPNSFELGETYYFLGKALAGLGFLAEAIPSFEHAARVLQLVEPWGELTRKAEDELAHLRALSPMPQLVKLPTNYEPEETIEVCALQDSLRILHECNYARELKGKTLEKNCNRLGITVFDDNEFIAELLLLYYCDEKKGERRCLEDRFFHCDFLQYNPYEVVAKLNDLSGVGDFLTVTDVHDGSWPCIYTKRIDGYEGRYSCASSLTLLNAYNSMLEDFYPDFRFYPLQTDIALAAYFLRRDMYEHLSSNYILRFDDK